MLRKKEEEWAQEKRKDPGRGRISHQKKLEKNPRNAEERKRLLIRSGKGVFPFGANISRPLYKKEQGKAAENGEH